MPHLLEVDNLTTAFQADYGSSITVDHVSFHVDRGEVVCIVGESGCGKSVTSLSIMGLLKKGGAVIDGSVLFDGKELLNLSEKELDRIRGNEMTMIFQDPLTSLNPVLTIGNQLTESIRRHMDLSREQAQYPHTLSGGMRQRVMIAMAISCNPRLLIADEPTTALDVTIQAQIMRLLHSLQEENGMSIILITHDIGLVANMADRVIVMYAGQIIEEGSVREIFRDPRHPYTKALLATVPTVKDDKDRELLAIPGMVPEDYDDMQGCRFAPRCPYCREICKEPQESYTFGEGHTARCIVAAQNRDDTGLQSAAVQD